MLRMSMTPTPKGSGANNPKSNTTKTNTSKKFVPPKEDNTDVSEIESSPLPNILNGIYVWKLVGKETSESVTFGDIVIVGLSALLLAHIFSSGLYLLKDFLEHL